MTTVELGSFSGAVEALNYLQSGISRMIADIEKDYHLPLMERDRIGIRLTSDGLRLLPYAPASFAVNSGAFRSRWMI